MDDPLGGWCLTIEPRQVVQARYEGRTEEDLPPINDKTQWAAISSNESSQAADEYLDYQRSLESTPKDLRTARWGGEVMVPLLGIKCDAVSASQKLVIEFLGCYYHSCPICYGPERQVSDKLRKTLNRRAKRTAAKIANLEALGWTVRVMWECDWKRKRQEILKEHREQLATAGVENAQSSVPTWWCKKKHYTTQLVNTIASDPKKYNFFGLVQCTVRTPPEVRKKLGDRFPPIFRFSQQFYNFYLVK